MLKVKFGLKFLAADALEQISPFDKMHASCIHIDKKWVIFGFKGILQD